MNMTHFSQAAITPRFLYLIPLDHLDPRIRRRNGEWIAEIIIGKNLFTELDLLYNIFWIVGRESRLWGTTASCRGRA